MENSVEERLKEQRDYRRKRNKNYFLKKFYGITLEDYNALLEQQEGVCKICGEECISGRSLAVDHDHDTGQIRGLLCSRCNVGIGSLRTIPNLKRAIIYLKESS